MATKKYLIVCGGSGKYVLGQRRVLGLDGEIQVDVSEEIKETREELGLDKDKDFSVSVAADVCAANVAELLKQVPSIARAQNWGEAEKKHANFLMSNFLGTQALKDGMSQAAAIGGLAIMHPNTQLLLGKAIYDLVKLTAKSNEDLDFWIISSTSGGTGEGTHRAIMDKIIEVTKNEFSGAKKIKNIRIGKATYNTIGGDNATVQNFIGICGDAKFPEKMRKKYPGNNATYNWYYIDLPDYGSGPSTKIPRGRMVSLAAKALMLDDLVDALQLLESNANTAIIRTGYWGKEYDSETLYIATLNGFIVKLEALIAPQPEDLFRERTRPDFLEGEVFSHLLGKLTDTDNVIGRLDSGWSISTSATPRAFDGLDAYLTENITSMHDLFGDFKYRDMQIQPKFMTQVNLNNNQQVVPFQSKDHPDDTSTWYLDYRNAQSVSAWARSLLGIHDTLTAAERSKQRNQRPWYIEGGLLDQLFKKHEECKKALKGGIIRNSSDRARAFARSSREYASLLMQCAILFDELINAEKLIKLETKPLAVLEFAKKRRDAIVKEQVSRTNVVTANLMDILDHLNRKSWFDMVYDTVRRNQTEEFTAQILKGAVVLTKEGLKEVLGLPQNSGTDEIKAELKENVGRMYDKDGKSIQALWMCNQDPNKVPNYGKFSFRLLPRLEEGLQNEIADEENSFKFPTLGVLGLYVLALEGLTVATKQDMIMTPTFLIKPLVPIVQKVMGDWAPHRVGYPTPRMQLALAGVVGDPLPLEVLKDAGFSEKDIKNLSEYYTITNFEEAQNQI